MRDIGVEPRVTIPIAVGHVSVQLYAEGDAIARITRGGKSWETQTRAAWAELVAPGELVLDVGAYTGIYSIASALMGAHVMAIEPHPGNYARLLMNCALNSTRIQALPVAASNENATQLLCMKRAEGLCDTASISYSDRMAVIDKGEYGIAIPCKRIDDIAASDTRVALIKIDVERHERAVLVGALETIYRHKPAVIVETLGEAERQEVDAIMSIMKYRQSDVFDGRNRLYVAERPGNGV
jgi:FkbM family methyltransferase